MTPPFCHSANTPRVSGAASISDGVNGALAGSMDQWLQKMEWLATDRTARASIAARGLQTIRERFAPDVVFEELQRAFTRLADAPRPASQPVTTVRQAR